jgi:hypothetical protein
MYNINYCLTRLLISPIFPYLPFILGVSLFLSLKYFEPAYFCDGESIEELKNKLSEETIKYNETMKKIDDFNDKMNITEQEKKYDLAYYCDFKYECKADKACEIFYKIRDIEENINTLNKNFESSIKEPDFL